jgi:hypothetical protein
METSYVLRPRSVISSARTQDCNLSTHATYGGRRQPLAEVQEQAVLASPFLVLYFGIYVTILDDLAICVRSPAEAKGLFL